MWGLSLRSQPDPQSPQSPPKQTGIGGMIDPVDSPAAPPARDRKGETPTLKKCNPLQSREKLDMRGLRLRLNMDYTFSR
jgi:hypothetical protein